MRYLLTTLSLLLSLSVFALDLKPNAPMRYVIKKGDTLWGIANRFLVHPWEWQQLWHNNPKIKNPRRLYQGAILRLGYYQNKPYIQVLSNGTIKLSPHLRPEPIKNPIPAIPLSIIKPFLNGSQVLDQDWLKKAPYIIAFTGEHLRGGQGDEVYVNKLHPTPSMPRGATQSYVILRPGKPYFEANTQRFLGYQSNLIGYAELVKIGNPATIRLTVIKDGIKIKDRVLLNHYPEFPLYFAPKTPSFPIIGKIIDLLDDYTQGAVGLVAVLDKGEDAGLEPGDVLAINSKRHAIADPFHRHTLIPLPAERIGEVMIFKTFRYTSYGLVVRSTRSVTFLDTVTNP